MRNAETALGIIQQRGKQGQPLERVYRLLFNRNLYLLAYGKLYRNKGAMTPGATGETVDGMTMSKIDATEIDRGWSGTTWFIEGDIAECFDRLDHKVLLDVLGEHIHDNRSLRLLAGLLEAGYLEGATQRHAERHAARRRREPHSRTSIWTDWTSTSGRCSNRHTPAKPSDERTGRTGGSGSRPRTRGARPGARAQAPTWASLDSCRAAGRVRRRCPRAADARSLPERKHHM